MTRFRNRTTLLSLAIFAIVAGAFLLRLHPASLHGGDVRDGLAGVFTGVGLGLVILGVRFPRRGAPSSR